MQSFNHLNDIFESIVAQEAESILKQYPGLFLIDNAFDVFAFEYDALFDYYSKKFMYPAHEFDTHKQIAIIVIALLKAKIIKTFSSDYYQAEVHRCAFNETLAFSVGCDMLGSIIREDYISDDKIDEEERQYSIKMINENGIVFPKTNYSQYFNNVVTEFFFTTREGNYNFLGLADKFFWIEYFNKRQIKKKFLEYKY